MGIVLAYPAHPGWMNFDRGLSEVVLAEIHAPAPDQEWQMLSSFLAVLIVISTSDAGDHHPLPLTPLI
jgi:hypothetical protein